MADLDSFLRYLARGDVEELVLQTGKVAALRLANGNLHPLTKVALTAGHVVALLDGIGLRDLIPAGDTAGEPAAVKVDGVDYRCRVARRGDQMQVRFSHLDDAPAARGRSPSTSASAGVVAPTPTRPRSEPVAAPQRTSPAPSLSPSPSPSPAPSSVGPIELELDTTGPDLSLGTAAPASPSRPSTPSHATSQPASPASTHTH
ncbi:MAG: hypothetical protein KC457_25940, partial [Myxococcales bacterium]|nr:hypothetical protein [Myxococcales bacterium]